ncbi:hypothetical protein [Luteimonas saliphila]|uniref:hypothetical protein n=1 Tax=Luteimonas saliphila TaxID=2804919 RepID=UPI00192DF103|nr:hypothetical protein [Luteimonas saliphila]
MEQRFRRRELHDLVWSEPLAKLAPRFGMSDVALAKTCKRHGIPIPGRSHWAKLKAGKPSPQFPLPPRGLGVEETITIGHTPWNETDAARQALTAEDVPPPPEFIEPLSDVLIRIEKLVERVPQSRNLKSPHREIAKLLEVDDERRGKWRQSSYPSSYDQPFFIAPYEQRRLKLLDAIFNATSRLGMTPSAQRRKNPDSFSVKIGDVHVGFKLDKPKEERSTWTSTSEPRRPAPVPVRPARLAPITRTRRTAPPGSRARPRRRH